MEGFSPNIASVPVDSESFSECITEPNRTFSNLCALSLASPQKKVKERSAGNEKGSEVEKVEDANLSFPGKCARSANLNFTRIDRRICG